MNFSAVILAGGNSSRMGRDKAWLEVGGKPILERQIERAREAGAAEVFISGRADTDYSGFGARVLRDQFVGVGPLAGIERALATAKSPLLLVLAVDLVEMSADFLRRLADGCAMDVGMIPRVMGNLEPLAAFYPKSAHQLVSDQLEEGNFAVKDFARRAVQRGLSRFFEVATSDMYLFANWNSPADMMRVNG